MVTISQIDAFIELFNNSWVNGDLSALEPLLDNNVVFISPDLKNEIAGKTECIQTFKDYLDHAVTNKFHIINRKIHTWDGSVMVMLEYEVEYLMTNTVYKEKGKEIWLLGEREGRLRMLWRALIENRSIN